MNSHLDITPPSQSQLDQFDLGIFVEQISQRQAQRNQPAELRMAIRHPFPEPILLTPVDQALQVMGPTITTIGRDLSRTGIGFFHTEAISANHVVIQFDEFPDRGVLTRLIWCRFRHDKWFVSGGNFAKVVEVPQAC